MIDINNFYKPLRELFDIDMIQDEIDGGCISYEEIDSIKENAKAQSIIISGLKQDTFDYFVEKYGDQFEVISFWKNKSVQDLSILAKLKRVKYISYFYNQNASELWDMSHNDNLRGLSVMDFRQLHSISCIASSKCLEYFRIGDSVYPNMSIDSLEPIAMTSVSHFEWMGKEVKRNDFKCLAKGKIKKLDISPTIFTMNELAELLSCFPDTLEGSITIPYITTGIMNREGFEEHYLLCKGKKRCTKGVDDKRFYKYLDDFSKLLLKYRENNVIM